MTIPIIYVISDSIGETAEFVAKAAIAQFDSSRMEIRRVPYVNSEEQLEQILEEAHQFKALVAFTLVIPELRDYLLRIAGEKNIITVDIMRPMMEAMERFTGLTPRLEPGLLHKMDEEYFRRVEAIEFAVKYDDGKDPRGVLFADIVLIGISRTSKTPLCMYLAHKNIKAANIPLVPEVSPPEELFELSPTKIVGLTLKPEILIPIRQERLLSLGLQANADYASTERILKEIEFAEEVMHKIGCPIIDVSKKAIEETAGRILQIYYRGERSERK